MTLRLTFRPEIPTDLASAANWYDHQHLGLGDEFLSDYRRTLDMLISSPLLRAADSTGMRFWRLKRFPYRILYRVGDNSILVAAVFHTRRDPNTLLERR